MVGAGGLYRALWERRAEDRETLDQLREAHRRLLDLDPSGPDVARSHRAPERFYERPMRLLIEVFRAGLRTLEEQGDLVNAEISAAQPIAIWVNYQQLRIAQNAIDVWSAVARPEDRRQPTCRWSMRGEQVWKDRCRAAYDMKEPVDTLHEKLHGARSQLTCGPPT